MLGPASHPAETQSGLVWSGAWASGFLKTCNVQPKPGSTIVKAVPQFPGCLGEIAIPQVLPAAWKPSVRMLRTGAEKGSGIRMCYFHPELACWASLWFFSFLQYDSKNFIGVCVCVCVSMPVSFIYLF